jgi:hypothetical protein
MTPESERQDPVWSLLQQARPVEVRQPFTNTVMRAMRAERERQQQRWSWLRALWATPGRRFALSSACALALGLTLINFRPHHLGEKAPLIATATVLMSGESDVFLDAVEADLDFLGTASSALSVPSVGDLADDDVTALLF